MAGHRWQKGVSGNPSGRPRGVVDRRRKLLDAALGDMPEIISAVVERARDGDIAAASLLFSRIFPPLRATGLPVRFAFDPGASLVQQCEQILAAASAGIIAPDVARLLTDALSALAEVRALADLEGRVAALEAGSH